MVECLLLQPLLVGQAERALEMEDVVGMVEGGEDLVAPEVAAEPVQGQQGEQHRHLDEEAPAVATVPPGAYGANLRTGADLGHHHEDSLPQRAEFSPVNIPNVRCLWGLEPPK